MLLFAGQNLLAIHEWPRAAAPEVHAQDNHFAGIQGVSSIFLGTGAREITIPVWLTDASFGSSAAVAAYVQSLDLGVGFQGDLQITGTAPNYFQDCRFEGFEPTSGVLPVVGGQLAGQWFQMGVLKFKQLTTP